MKRISIFLLLLCFTFLTSTGQQFQVGKRSQTFTDPSRNNRQIDTDLFYPANTNGTNVPIAAGISRFPIIVFGHGFVIGTASYTWLADSLVKYGYIVALPATEGGILPSHDNFGKDISFVSGAIASLGNDAGSFLFQRVIPKAAVGGHSMGGGCSFLAASGNQAVIQALFNFAAAETNPSATAAAVLINKPSLLFSGSNDCIVPPATQQAMYANLTSTCKTYINITGATHCQFADNNFVCTLGQVTTGCNSSPITTGIVFSKVASLLIPFLDYYLKDDCNRGIDYLNVYNSLTGAVKLNTCNTFPSCGVVPVTLVDFTGKLSGKTITLNWKTASEINFSYFEVEKSFDGSNFNSFVRVQSKGGPSAVSLYTVSDKNPYPENCYYRLKIVNADGGYSYSSVIRIKTSKKAIVLNTVYPNPVIHNASLQFYSGIQQRIIVKVFNVQGICIISKSVNLQKGITNDILMTNSLSAGTYFLRITNPENDNIHTATLIKE